MEFWNKKMVHDRSTTDASAIHLQREGIPTGIITIPRRYSHSPIKVAGVKDVVNTFLQVADLTGFPKPVRSAVSL